jgi:hypothetical protein
MAMPRLIKSISVGAQDQPCNQLKGRESRETMPQAHPITRAQIRAEHPLIVLSRAMSQGGKAHITCGKQLATHPRAHARVPKVCRHCDGCRPLGTRGRGHAAYKRACRMGNAHNMFAARLSDTHLMMPSPLFSPSYSPFSLSRASSRLNQTMYGRPGSSPSEPVTPKRSHSSAYLSQ